MPMSSSYYIQVWFNFQESLMRHCWPYAYASTATLHSRMDTLDKLKNGSTSQALIYFSDVLPFLSNASIALFASLMACEGRRKVLKNTNNCFNPFPPVSANWQLYRFYSVKRQTILLVNGEPLGQERVKCIDGFQSRDNTVMLVDKTTANYGSCFA